MNLNELSEFVERVRAALQPAPRQQVSILLTRLSIHFWQPDKPESHWDLLIEDYLDDLSHYPIDMVADAIVDYRRHGGQFFPKVSDLIERIQPKHDARLAELAEVERLIEQRSRAAAPKPSLADKDEVSRLMKEARGHLTG